MLRRAVSSSITTSGSTSPKYTKCEGHPQSEEPNPRMGNEVLSHILRVLTISHSASSEEDCMTMLATRSARRSR